MAYDEGLAFRLEQLLGKRNDLVQKKMFGGLCFMIRDHMCCGIVGNRLMARVGAQRYDECLKQQFASAMDFTGRAMKGMLYISPEGLESDDELEVWVNRCLDFVTSLPDKNR